MSMKPGEITAIVSCSRLCVESAAAYGTSGLEESQLVRLGAAIAMVALADDLAEARALLGRYATTFCFDDGDRTCLNCQSRDFLERTK